MDIFANIYHFLLDKHLILIYIVDSQHIGHLFRPNKSRRKRVGLKARLPGKPSSLFITSILI